MNAHPWEKSYPAGVRWDAALRAAPLQSVLEASAKRFADHPALEFMGRRITYAELDALANRAAAGFQKLGVGPGVHVGLYMPNTPHYVIAFFGVLKAGGVVVNYSPLDVLKTLQFKIENSETDFLVTLDLAALMPQAEALLIGTRVKALIVGEFPEFAAAPGPVAAHMKAASMLVEVKRDEHHLTFASLLDNDGHYVAHPLGDLADALAVIQYTGGTTGTPKGAMLSHANLTSACRQYTIHRLGRRRDRARRGRGAHPVRAAALSHLCALGCSHHGAWDRRRSDSASALRSGGGRKGHFREEDHCFPGRPDHACRAPEPAGSQGLRLLVPEILRLGRGAASRRGVAPARGDARLPHG